MNLFIGPQDSSSWSLTADTFTDALRSRWPKAHVKRIEDPEDCEILTFAFEGQEGPVEGALARASPTLVLEYGTPRDLAEVVVLFRALAPPDDDLVMVKESGGAYSIITPQTTVADVAATLDP